MNIEDFKKDWENDNAAKVVLPESLLKLKTANLPKEKIYRLLKRELIVQAVAFAFTSLWPVVFHFKQPYFNAFYVFLVSGLLLSAYHVTRFRMFSRKIAHNTLSSKDHLYELYYDVRLVMELYKSWTYLIIPFGIIFGFLHLAALGHDLARMLTSYESIFVVIALFIVLPLTEMYINAVYGKYTRQLKQLLDELNEA